MQVRIPMILKGFKNFNAQCSITIIESRFRTDSVAGTDGLKCCLSFYLLKSSSNISNVLSFAFWWF